MPPLINVFFENIIKLSSLLFIFLHESNMSDMAFFEADSLFESWQECVDE